ncbi:MAG: SDR family oxidoreductase [Hyphomicrobiaceae bacterium]
MSNQFNDMVVVIGGASRGIGFGIARAFAGQGAHVVLAASSAENLTRAAEHITKDVGTSPTTITADLRTLEGCQHVFSSVKNSFGRCNVLVNSAGATKAGAFVQQSDEDWQDGFALKFHGCVRLCRLFWPYLKESSGTVVNIIGGAARTPDPEFLVGGAVNAAMANFTKGLAGLGKRDGVRVNAILPGLTETERVQTLFEQRAAATGSTADAVRQSAIEKEGLNRLGTPEDVAALALFLAGPDAGYIQGTSIAVDGGSTAGVY